MSDWIRADIRRPKLNQLVLVVTDENNYFIAWYIGKGKFKTTQLDRAGEEMVFTNVVYWMVLPALPIELNLNK